MNEFHELLINRRSVRKYTDTPLEPEQVQSILEAALLSPSGKSRQPWQFVVVEDKATLERLSKAKEHGAGLLKNASLAIVILGDPYLADTWVEDCSIAATLIQLECESQGLGSCWVQMHKRMNETGYLAEDTVREMLNIPLIYNVLCAIAIGQKAEEKKPADLEKLKWEKVHIGAFRNDEE